MAEFFIQIGAEFFAALLVSGVSVFFATPAIRVITFLVMIVGGSIAAWFLAGATGTTVSSIVAIIGLMGLFLNGYAEKRRIRR